MFFCDWYAALLGAAAYRSGLWLLLGFLGQQYRLDVRQNTSLGYGDTGQQFVQFLVVTYRQLQMSGNYTRFLVVSGGVAGQFQYFGSQILHNCGQIDGRSGSYAFGIITFAQESMDTADRKLQSGATGTRLRLPLNLAAFASTRHVVRSRGR